jgi:hypothetical protein
LFLIGFEFPEGDMKDEGYEGEGGKIQEGRV